MNSRPGCDDKPRRCFGFLVLLFLATLPFLNPWVRGDGVGYYAYARSLLIDHALHFEPDWQHANPSFREGRMDFTGQILASQYTSTGHLDNHFTVGPALLWLPFLTATHEFIKLADRVGFHIPADGFSRPYRITMAVATALYGFAGLLLAFDLARKYFDERWAFLATAAGWFATSLPVYMYFNPSWSHAHSAFAVSLFLWYWHRTLGVRSLRQWMALGLCAGLMINVYYLNALFLLPVAYEAVARHFQFAPPPEESRDSLKLAEYVLFAVVIALALMPTVVTRLIIYGSPLNMGYPPLTTWAWTSPKVLSVLFSADHGLLSWTPIVGPALVGLVFFNRRDRLVGGSFGLTFVAFLYCIASYASWDGISSFGNRFFISFTPVFIIGLAALLDKISSWFANPTKVLALTGIAAGVLVAWNFGLMLQWGTQMIPARGPISWQVMIQNQMTAVPRRLAADVNSYFIDRRMMMDQIENRDQAKQQRGDAN